MRTELRPNLCTVTFDDVADLVATAHREPLLQWQGTSEYSLVRHSSTTHDKWAGGTFDDAVSLAEAGWKEGADMVRDMARGVAAPMLSRVSMRHETTYDVAGDETDMGRYMAGEPECMTTWREIASETPSVRFCDIAVSIGQPYTSDPANIMRRGATIVALVDMLESAGIRCSVTASDHALDGVSHWVASWPLKAASDAMDVDRLAFWLAHPSVQRRMLFAVQAATNPAHFGGFGATRPSGIAADITVDPSDIWTSDESARAWLADKIDAISKS